jgi:4-diphosphocytidyl-2-C-methyl-D-erythritol kinase
VIIETARAKINLTLQVLGRRPDGYHDLVSLVAFADVGDTVVFETGARPEIHTDGPFAGRIDGENLIAKAFRLVQDAHPGAPAGRVLLTKNLPVAAGLGGGSADAAAALRALKRAEPGLEAKVDIKGIARKLGADVTVCLQQRAALMWGIGEQVAMLEPLPAFWFVLVNPGVPLSTAEVFRTLSAPLIAGSPPAPALPGPFAGLDSLVAYMRATGNGLQATGIRLCPPVATVLAALAAQSHCRYAAQSGSGPTCFGVFAIQSEAQAAAAALSAARTDWWVAAASVT